MSKLIRASALVFLLACSASAGVMMPGVVNPPPPPPPEQQSSQEVPEPVETQETAETDEVTPLVIQIALDLFALL